jgi:uncharacterized membrane protein
MTNEKLETPIHQTISSMVFFSFITGVNLTFGFMGIIYGEILALLPLLSLILSIKFLFDDSLKLNSMMDEKKD